MKLNVRRAAIAAALLVVYFADFAGADEIPITRTDLRELLSSEGHEGNANLDSSAWASRQIAGLSVEHRARMSDERMGHAEIGMFVGESVDYLYDPGKDHGLDQKPVGMYMKFRF